MQLLSSKKPTLGISFCIISCLLLAPVSYVLLWSAFPSKLTEVWGLDNKGYHRLLMHKTPQESISVSSNNDGSRGDQEKSVDPTVPLERAFALLDVSADQQAGHQGGGSEQDIVDDLLEANTVDQPINFASVAWYELVNTFKGEPQPQPVQP
eukprot:GHVS01062064.1.p1 GENE.GHVS01062064.1~~GHVS01062064.1.p1  ORF type:complete len:152 (+),score=7.39 GHVS01062064.1:136-591(+)